MISFIVSSTCEARAEALRSNIDSHLGMPFEFIAIENRQHPRSIAQVYNKGASAAQGQVLCFLHEDIAFHSSGWGQTVESKALQSDCGLVGFIGSWYKSLTPSGWSIDKDTDIGTFIQGGGNKPKTYSRRRQDLPFEPCAVVDGFCMFVSKAHWKAHPFDEQIIRSFHAYDIDFSLTLMAAGLQNYVCHIISIEHFSPGHFGQDWLKATLCLHDKWQDWLPMYVGEPLSQEAVRDLEQRAAYRFCKLTLRSDIRLADAFSLIHHAQLPPAKKLKLCAKLLFYRLRGKLTR